MTEIILDRKINVIVADSAYDDGYEVWKIRYSSSKELCLTDVFRDKIAQAIPVHCLGDLGDFNIVIKNISLTRVTDIGDYNGRLNINPLIYGNDIESLNLSDKEKERFLLDQVYGTIKFKRE